MTFWPTALLISLKVAGVLVAVLAGLVILLISLPVRVRLSLNIAARRLLERILDEDAKPFFRMAGGRGDETEPEDGVVPVELGYDLDISPLSGAVEVRVSSGAATQVAVMGARFRAGGRREKEQSHHGRKPRIISLAWLREYLAAGVPEKAVALVKDLFRAVYFEGDLDIECGFPDPGLTGMAFAAYVALGGPSSFGGVRFRPSFQEEMMDVRGTVQLNLVPARVAWIVGRFLLSREIRPLWRKRDRNLNAGAAGAQAKPALQDTTVRQGVAGLAERR